MNLYLIRHAEPDYESDTLTENGKLQAEKLGSWFNDVQIDELYHSSMGRAEMTASYIAQKKGIAAVSFDWARELCWGDASGDPNNVESPWTKKDSIILINHSYPEEKDLHNIPEFKNDRLIKDIEERFKAFDSFIAEHGYVRKNQLYKAETPNNKNIVLVCHGGMISALTSYLMNIPFIQYIAHMNSDFTAVTKVHFDGQPGEILPAKPVYINSQIHLGEK